MKGFKVWQFLLAIELINDVDDTIRYNIRTFILSGIIFNCIKGHKGLINSTTKIILMPSSVLTQWYNTNVETLFGKFPTSLIIIYFAFSNFEIFLSCSRIFNLENLKKKKLCWILFIEVRNHSSVNSVQDGNHINISLSAIILNHLPAWKVAYIEEVKKKKLLGTFYSWNALGSLVSRYNIVPT